MRNSVENKNAHFRALRWNDELNAAELVIDARIILS
jgi:hypothetical protein